MTKTLFSGLQPTGSMHVGNYLGAIENWINLQDQYDCIYCIVDYHALTGTVDTSSMQSTILEMATWLLACGLAPEKCTLFVQSQVPEHTELCWIFNTVTPMGELSRMTQFKDKSQNSSEAGSVNVGLFDYPVLQAADILLYKASVVPVGEDQRQHLEITREIARKFNSRYGDMFPDAQPVILPGKRARVLGVDGQNKMSKSLDNHIPLSGTPEESEKRTLTMLTDPQRARLKDPGRPEVCNVFTFHGFFSTDDQRNQIESECREATIGCFACKKQLAANINERFEPIRERARNLTQHPDDVRDVLTDGAKRARSRAQETMDEVRRLVGLR
jgi:tryptophanyl-tRNA synthetase